jgi:hypothetical protein
MKTKKNGPFLRISIIMILTASIVLVNPVLAEYATVTVNEVPPETLGTIGLNETLNLEFGASISKAWGSYGEFVVNFSRVGFTFEGFTATLNGTDISTSFIIDANDTTVHAYSDPPIFTPNGTYSMTVKFKTKNIEGNYTFDWQLWVVGLSYPPDPPILNTTTGKTNVEIKSSPVATIEETLEITNDYIQELEVDVFKNKASKKKKVFDNMFNTLDKKLADEDYEGMINFLLHNVRRKVDGHVDGSLKNDWITDPDVQEELCRQIDDIIDYLTSLL